MEQFLERLFNETNKWVIFFVTILISVIIGVLLFIPFAEDWKQLLILPLVIGIILGATLSSVIGMFRIGEEFYSFADEVELMIREGKSVEDVKTKLFELHKKSFHRTTSNRVRELAKMIEIKYDVVLLNR